jgi:CRISPR/Cas system-associated protein Cas10 (large subunit of type III CRISPR-Cas system)
MELPTIKDFHDFLLEHSKKYSRYEYANPLYNKRKKAHPYKSIYLQIKNNYNLFYIYEDTTIQALKELGNFLGDYLDGLYPEIQAPFKLIRIEGEKRLIPQSLKKIQGLHIVWAGKATNPEKGQF